jgi:hypothetical protein
VIFSLINLILFIHLEHNALTGKITKYFRNTDDVQLFALLIKNFVVLILEHDALTGKYSANGIFFYHEAHEDNEEKTSISSCASW